MTAGMASLAKMNNAPKAREIVADARDIMGGNGILLDNRVARHHADIEAIFTYEGTDTSSRWSSAARSPAFRRLRSDE